MFEIELKAHVNDRNSVEKQLASFAKHEGTVEKHDVYWSSPEKQLEIRIREETSEKQTKTIVTYKRKKILTAENGSEFEMNDENEFNISDRKPFEVFLSDSGFVIKLLKHKTVQEWHYSEALLELCHVESLGDFLEIEILTANNNNDEIKQSKDKLFQLLERCNIPRYCIEKRYYSEMLANRQKTSNAGSQ